MWKGFFSGCNKKIFSFVTWLKHNCVLLVWEGQFNANKLDLLKGNGVASNEKTLYLPGVKYFMRVVDIRFSYVTRPFNSIFFQ